MNHYTGLDSSVRREIEMEDNSEPTIRKIEALNRLLTFAVIALAIIVFLNLP